MAITLPYLSTVLCIFMGLLLGGLLLFSPYYRNKANRLLGGIFWIISLLGATVVLAESEVENKWFIVFNDIMWEYLVGPFFLLYFAKLVGHPLAETAKRYWLYVPFCLTLVVNIVLDLDMELGLIDISVANDTPAVQYYYFLEYTGSILYTVVICVLARLIINGEQAHPVPRLANEMWWWFAAATLIWSFSWWLDSLVSFDLTLCLFFVLLLMFCWIGYRGVVQLQLTASREELRAVLDDKYTSIPVPPANAVNPVIESVYLAEFARLMQEEKWYRNPKLSRDLVAGRLGISSSHLSGQLSTSELGCFSDYVNSWRVEETKLLLLDPEFSHYSILSIGLEAGFNSKSAFYSAFRKATGKTPLGFKKAHVAEQAPAYRPDLSGTHN